MNLNLCLDENDPQRSYIHFSTGDEIVLMVSNFGGISPLEMGALTDELLSQLESKYSINPVRVYTGPIETSLNAPAFSTSILNLSVASKSTLYSVSQILEFLDAKSSTQWEAVAGSQTKRRPRKEQIISGVKEEPPRKLADPSKDLKGT